MNAVKHICPRCKGEVRIILYIVIGQGKQIPCGNPLFLCTRCADYVEVRKGLTN